MNKNGKIHILQICACIAADIIFAAVLVYIIKSYNLYPVGSDVYGHLYKVTELAKYLKGTPEYPIYSEFWYSGMELFRYWPPFSYLPCAIFYLITDNIYTSYLIFLFLVFAIESLGWLLFGIKENRIWLGCAVGMLFLILPDNLRVLLSEGNLPRIFITALLPYYFLALYEFIFKKKRKALILSNIILFLIVCSHIMISAMVGVSSFLFLLIYAIRNRDPKNSLICLMNIIFPYLEAGILLIPAVIGGLVSQNSEASSSTSADWSQNGFISLNPVARLLHTDLFYFGITIFLISILGIIASRRGSFEGFLSSILIFIGTTMFIYPIISELPLSQVWWMIRFVPMAMTLFFASFIKWDRLKPAIVVVFLVLIFIDSSASLYAFCRSCDRRDYSAREEDLEDKYLLKDAYELTENQFALIDLSSIGSYPAYAITKDGRQVRYLFGWGYQGAGTVEEIVEINEAFEEGWYDYAFDRLSDYGCDTVIIKKDVNFTDKETVVNKAFNNNYMLFKENTNVWLFKLEYEGGEFGVKKEIENVCIGNGSAYISYLFPSFYKLKDNYLDDYTFDELKDYKKIFVSGPYYKNKEYCETLVEKLADSGVKIYVDMANLQEEKTKGKNSFLGVYAQPISFTEEFPVLELDNGSQFKLPLDTERYDNWRTVYLTNLKTEMKKSRYQKGKSLCYEGKGDNENIVFLGLNLVYYCSENPSDDLYSLLEEIFEEKKGQIPEKRYVSIKSSVEKNSIFLSSDEDDVMTGFANLSCFSSGRDLGRESFVTLQKGDTVIRATYSHLGAGILMSIIGTAGYVIYILLCLKKKMI